MGVVDYIAIAVIALIIGSAVFYIIRAKKSGAKCIGCNHSGKCHGKCGCAHGRSSKNNSQK